jgi:hypothetical protein
MATRGVQQVRAGVGRLHGRKGLPEVDRRPTDQAQAFKQPAWQFRAHLVQGLQLGLGAVLLPVHEPTIGGLCGGAIGVLPVHEYVAGAVLVLLRRLQLPL